MFFDDTSSGLDGGGSAEAASQPQRQKRTKSKGKFDRSFFVVFTSDDKVHWATNYIRGAVISETL